LPMLSDSIRMRVTGSVVVAMAVFPDQNARMV